MKWKRFAKEARARDKKVMTEDELKQLARQIRMELQDMGLAKWVTVDTAYDEFIIVQMKERFNDTFKDEQFKEISSYLQDIADENGLDYYGKESYGQIFNRPKGSWKYPVNESVDDEKAFKKLLRQNGITKLPSGMSSRRAGTLEWSKDGGYAGEKTIDRMRQQAEAAGWKQGREMDDAHPDGSWVARGDVYVSPDGQIEMSYYSYYGATSYDNSFSITFKMVGGAVNESDEEDSFTRSDRPQIYRYYDDDETPLEDFVKHVRSAEHQIEDLFIQNSDYYENEDDPWKTFCDDLSEGGSLEESLDMQYYMNQAAYDQLPDDIKKHTHLYTGTCEFDAVTWLREIFERLMPICKDQYNESSRFGFNVGDMVELTKDKSNTFTGETVKAGTQGEVVAVDKPMPGVIKVKIEGGKVVSVPERQLKKAGEDEEPWKKLKAPEQPKRDIRPERPEDYYMRPTSYGSPRYTGD